MLSLEECKKILHKNQKNFTDEEVLKIREILYKMAKIVISNPIIKNDEK